MKSSVHLTIWDSENKLDDMFREKTAAGRKLLRESLIRELEDVVLRNISFDVNANQYNK